LFAEIKDTKRDCFSEGSTYYPGYSHCKCHAKDTEPIYKGWKKEEIIQDF